MGINETPQREAAILLSMAPRASGNGPLPQADSLQDWIENTIAQATNRTQLLAQLQSIDAPARLLRFFHRFLVFNDALAARVPFLAGLIHLTPDIFIDRAQTQTFCRQVNGRVAAFVAEAASDEYHFSPERNLIHQYLSQRFFRAALDYHHIGGEAFDRDHPFPASLTAILAEARSLFFDAPSDENIFAALGFHVALELFANEEFNTVDQYLKSAHQELVQAMSRSDSGISDYSWLAIHTVVEIRHYRAGVEALHDALRFYHRPEEAAKMEKHVQSGFQRFIDLQYRYYGAIFDDAF
jgi:hypothetical protein